MAGHEQEEDGAAARAPRPAGVERTVEILAEPWAALILREAFFGVRRFEEFQRNLGISRSVLTRQLGMLIANQLVERRQYQTRPDRYEYRLTEAGIDTYPVFLAMMRWADRWLRDPDDVAVRLVHETCEHETRPLVVCSHCREAIEARQVTFELIVPRHQVSSSAASTPSPRARKRARRSARS